jgi:hypothetical protein
LPRQVFPAGRRGDHDAQTFDSFDSIGDDGGSVMRVDRSGSSLINDCNLIFNLPQKVS